MKILAIIGSPKAKGAGYAIVKMIEDRMKALGDVEFEYLFLKNANLLQCTGCYVCMARGEDKCPLKDDRALIEEKRMAADGVILSSPVYVNNVSALMKNFIDRFAYLLHHRPKFHRQKVLSVVNMGGGGQKEALSALRNALGGAQMIRELAIETPPWLQTERAVARKERAIEAAAGEFYNACLDTSLPVPTFARYKNFFIYKELSSVCQQSLPADYAFYKNKAFYYDTPSSPLKEVLAKAMVKFMMYAYVKNGLGPGSIKWPVVKEKYK